MSGWFTPCFALGQGSALHPRCRCEPLHSELQPERSQIFLLADKSLDPTSRAATNLHTSFGPGVRVDSWWGGLARTELATDQQGFCTRLVHSSTTETFRIWHSFVAAALLKPRVHCSVASTKAVAAALPVLARLLSGTKPLPVAGDATRQSRGVRLILYLCFR